LAFGAEDGGDVGTFPADRVETMMLTGLEPEAVWLPLAEQERRRVHRALDDALEDVDHDRWAWHRAAAADGADEEVVMALERVAVRAERHSGYITAAAAHERVAELSATEQGRPWRRSPSCRRSRWSPAPPRNSAPQVRRPAEGTRPPC
jgi:hypothetical protein